jgi:YbgC/YbaW family acyl-CoA thioester hydrolase
MREIRTRRKVEFADADMGGIVHFARYLVFMETAEHELLERAGFPMGTRIDGKTVLWPRVAAALQYKSPARFGDILDIHVEVMRKGGKSLTFACRIEVEGREIATSEWTTVCCEMEPGKPVRSIPIPEELAARLEEGPDS